jgi:hypothetical protein
MRKYLHTSIVVLCLLAGVAHGQFSGAWTNYFATEIIAQEAYLCAQERAKVASTIFIEPSWWDYIVGKNHAKLVAVKDSIINMAANNYVNHTLADTNGCFDSVFATNDSFSAVRFSKVALCRAAGIATNALDETPYFKTQNPSTIGGWHDARACLTTLQWFAVSASLREMFGIIKDGSSSNTYFDAYNARVATFTNTSSTVFAQYYAMESDQYEVRTIDPKYAIYTLASTNTYFTTNGYDAAWGLYSGTTNPAGTAYNKLDFPITSHYSEVSKSNEFSITPAISTYICWTNEVPFQGEVATNMGWRYRIIPRTYTFVFKLSGGSNGFKYK